jgi:hypothetical protein
LISRSQGGLYVDDVSQETERHTPVPFGAVAGDRRGFLVESDDDADSLAQMFVGKTDSVADKELFATSARWLCRFRLRCGARAIGDDGGIKHDPAAPGRMVLDG